MPIEGLQPRMRELGRIRIGDKGDRGAPHKLDSFRLTSSSEQLLKFVAHLYGGKVQPWKGAPTPGQFEVYTEAPSIPVLVPPGQVLSQWMEMWSGGGCQRRCDGLWEQESDQACLCPVDPEERTTLAQDGKACKPTTRLSVMLPDVPDLGVWRLETHGYYAAIELAGVSLLLAAATRQGVPVPASLRIEHRTSKNKGQTRRYIVPVLEMPETTAGQLVAAMRADMLLPGGERALLPEPEGEVVEPNGNGGLVAVAQREVAKAHERRPASEGGLKNEEEFDWKAWWPKAVSTLRCDKLPKPSEDDIHAALGVESVKDWPGRPQEALIELSAIKSMLTSGMSVEEAGAERKRYREAPLAERLKEGAQTGLPV